MAVYVIYIFHAARAKTNLKTSPPSQVTRIIPLFFMQIMSLIEFFHRFFELTTFRTAVIHRVFFRFGIFVVKFV